MSNGTNRYLTESGKLDLAVLYQDADEITNGASNPIAVAGTLHEMMVALSRTGHDTDAIKKHPAILCVFDQLHSIILGRTSEQVTLSAYDGLLDGVKRFTE